MRIFVCLLVLIVVALGTGCRANCKNACEKIIVDCDAGIPSYNTTQCEADCEEVLEDYEEFEYYATELEAFQEQLKCIRDSSCEELLDPDAPACYDESLYVF